MSKPKKNNNKSVSASEADSPTTSEKLRFFSGLLLLVFAIYMLVVFISYLSSGKADQDSVNLSDDETDYAYQNWGGKFGFKVGYYFIFKGFGLGSFFLPFVVGAFGLALMRVKYFRLWKNVLRFLIASILVSVILGFIGGHSSFLGAGPGGEHGYLIADWLNKLLGKVGTGSLMLVFTIAYLIFSWNVSPHSFRKPIAAMAKAAKNTAASLASGQPDAAEVTEDQTEEEPLIMDEEPAEIINNSHPLTSIINTQDNNDDEDSDFYKQPSSTGGSLISVIGKEKKKLMQD